MVSTAISFRRPARDGTYPVSVVVFAVASRKIDHGQLRSVSGLLFGELDEGATFHVPSWSSCKSRGTVKVAAAAHISAGGEGIDKGKLLRVAFNMLLEIKIDLIVALDLEDLFDTLSVRRNASDRSVRADVNIIRFEFETHAVARVISTPGRTNLAGLLAKNNSSLFDALQPLFLSATMPFALFGFISCSFDQSTS